MRKISTLLILLSLLLTLTACQADPAAPSEPEVDPIVYVRTSVQEQPDGDYGIWEYSADETQTRFTSYDLLGNFLYRIDYQYDAQGRMTLEQHQSLDENGASQVTHTRTYAYSENEVVIAVSDFGYGGAACGYTMSDPAHQVNIKGVGVDMVDGKVADLTIEELDAEGVWVTEQRIVLEQ